MYNINAYRYTMYIFIDREAGGIIRLVASVRLSHVDLMMTKHGSVRTLKFQGQGQIQDVIFLLARSGR